MTDLAIVQYGAIKSDESIDWLSNKELSLNELVLSDKQKLPTKSEISR